MAPTRRLAAIMAADVAGFSAAMERDEEGTFAQVQELRRTIIEPKIAEHHGRLVKTTGDGFLAEFASPIAAMRCALMIQAEAISATLQLRIGLNLGDVIVEEDGDLYGEGVNIAARLEALADTGGILISDKIFREVEGKIDASFEDRGEQHVKNLARPVRVYAARLTSARSTSTAAAAVVGESKPLPLPEKPSIAVLPFQNLSGDPEQEYFADGMVEEIITALSQLRQLFVIARNSTFTYKGRAVDVRQVSRELGVRYVLEGSIRKSVNRVRVTGQLVDARTGAHIWADKYDGGLEDVFEVQDRVARSVVGAVLPRLEEAEMDRAKRKPPESLDAFDVFLRAKANFYQWTRREHSDECLRLCQRVIELDPAHASAYALAATCHMWRRAQGWMTDRVRDIAECERLVRRALELGRDDAFALAYGGYTLGREFGELEDACEYADRSLALNPNFATGWFCSGSMRTFLGESQTALDHFARAVRLSPFDPHLPGIWAASALAHIFMGDFDEASRLATKSLQILPNATQYLLFLAASLALGGHQEDARRVADRLRRLDPERPLADPRDVLPALRRPEHLARILEGLRLAGIPE